jgi:hypothetical protein
VSRASGSGDAEAIQRRVRQVRDQVLGGRGPGASPLETAAWMSERPGLGGEAPAAAREAVTERAAAARGDPAALTRLIARHGARLAASLPEITSRSRRHARLAAPAAVAIVGAALAIPHAGRRLTSPSGHTRS